MTTQRLVEVKNFIVATILGHEVATREDRKTTTPGATRGFTRARLEQRTLAQIDGKSVQMESLDRRLADAFPDVVIEFDGGVLEMVEKISRLGFYTVTPEEVTRQDGSKVTLHAIALTGRAFNDELRALNAAELQATRVATENGAAVSVAKPEEPGI